MTWDPDSQLQLRGVSSLDDAALLSFLLTRGGPPGDSALALARRVLECAGGLHRLGRCLEGELCSVPGIGPARARRILALCELNRRVAERPALRGQHCLSPRDVFELVRGQLGSLKHESFWVLYLDCQGRKLNLLEVALGGRNAVSVTPSDIFGPAVREAAMQIVLIHNHPSGDPEPSCQDRLVTERMSAAGELLGVPVVDHIIVGGGTYCSLAERGLINQAEGVPMSIVRQPMVTSIPPAYRVRPSGPRRTRSQPGDATEEVSISLEDETTTWVFPEQLPLPFIYEDRMPRYATEGLLPRRDVILECSGNSRPHGRHAATICDGGSTISCGEQSDDGPTS